MRQIRVRKGSGEDPIQYRKKTDYQSLFASYIGHMQNLRTRDKVALVIALLTVISVAQSGNGLIDILIGVFLNVAIVYGVVTILDFFKNRS